MDAPGGWRPGSHIRLDVQVSGRELGRNCNSTCFAARCLVSGHRGGGARAKRNARRVACTTRWLRRSRPTLKSGTCSSRPNAGPGKRPGNTLVLALVTAATTDTPTMFGDTAMVLVHECRSTQATGNLRAYKYVMCVTVS